MEGELDRQVEALAPAVEAEIMVVVDEDVFFDESDFNLDFMEEGNYAFLLKPSPEESNEASPSLDSWHSDSDDEDDIEALRAILQDDRVDIQKIFEEGVGGGGISGGVNHGPAFEGGSKHKQPSTRAIQNSVGDLLSRNGSLHSSGVSQEDERVATVLDFLELRSKGVTDKARWATVAHSSMVYTSPGVPSKNQANVQTSKRKVRGRDAVASDLDVYRLFSNLLNTHFGQQDAIELSIEVDSKRTIFVTGDKGIAYVALRSRGLREQGMTRELEEKGMLYCHFQPGSKLLTSLEIAVNASSLASQLHHLTLLTGPKFSQTPAVTRTITNLPGTSAPAYMTGSPRSGDAKSTTCWQVSGNHASQGGHPNFSPHLPSHSIICAAPVQSPDPGKMSRASRKKRRRAQQQLQVPVNFNQASANLMAAALNTQSYFAAQYLSQMAAMSAMAQMAGKQFHHTNPTGHRKRKIMKARQVHSPSSPEESFL